MCVTDQHRSLLSYESFVFVGERTSEREGGSGKKMGMEKANVYSKLQTHSRRNFARIMIQDILESNYNYRRNRQLYGSPRRRRRP